MPALERETGADVAECLPSGVRLTRDDRNQVTAPPATEPPPAMLRNPFEELNAHLLLRPEGLPRAAAAGQPPRPPAGPVRIAARNSRFSGQRPPSPWPSP